MVADFNMPPQADPPAVGSRQVGSSSPARTRSCTGSAGCRWSQRRQTISDELPWISTISAGVGPCLLMQPVDVLGDQGVQLPARSRVTIAA